MPTGIYLRKPMPEEVKIKISEKMKGIKRSKITKEKIKLAKLGDKNPMYKKEFSFEHRDRMSKSHKGNLNYNFKGRIYRNGYIKIYLPEHPFADKQGHYREHRLIVEKIIGGYLHRYEVCHHINKIKDDNRIENLMVFKNQGIHTKFEKGCKVNPRDIIFDGRKLLEVAQ